MENKPYWWPKNPYSKAIFTMKRNRYQKIVPDPELRTALSGMLGREFWDIASDMIWDRMRTAIEDGYVLLLLPSRVSGRE